MSFQNLSRMFSLRKLRKESKKICCSLIIRLRCFKLTKIILRLPIVKKNLYVKQLIKFILVGGLSTLIDFSLYIFLTRFFSFWQAHYLWANFTGMIIASLINFLLNKRWTFKSNGRKILHQYINFCIVLVFGLFLYQALFGFFVAAMGWYDIIAKALTAFLVMLIRFQLQKFWVFK